MAFDNFYGLNIKPWVRIPKKLFEMGELNGYERMVVFLLMSLAPDTPPIMELVSWSGFSKNTVYKALRSLEEKKFLVVTRKPHGIVAYNYQPLLMALMPGVEPRLDLVPDVQLPADVEIEDPDEKLFGMTPEQERRAEQVLGGRAVEWAQGIRKTSWITTPEAPTQIKVLKLSDLPASEYRRRLQEARRRPASIYYPGLADNGCEDRLQAIVEEIYAQGPGSHHEAWLAIENDYTQFVRQLAADRGYDSQREYDRVAAVYGRYLESVEDDGRLELQEFITRYYANNEFRGFDTEVRP